MVNLKYFFLRGSGTIIVDRVSNYFMGGRLKHLSPYLKQTISWEYAVNYECSICNTSDTQLLSIPVIRGCIYSDRQLTLNFELWVEIFVCRNVSIWGFQNRVCLSIRWSVRLSVPREKKSPWLRQYQSNSSNWYINGNVYTSTTAWKSPSPQKWFFKCLP